MPKREIYQGEGKVLPFRIKDKTTGRWLDLTGATFFLSAKRSPDDAEPIFTKVDADFEKAAVASGFVTVFLTAYDTFRPPWVYKAELRVIRTGSPAPITKLPFDLEILKAISPNDWVISPTGIASREAFGTPVITL